MTDATRLQPTDSQFSPKLKLYFLLQGILPLTILIIGIPLIPIWLVVGTWWADRYYKSLKIEITERNIVIKKGVLFHRELTIPLDKIQDISIHEGPLLKFLGLLNLRIETAGQRSASTGKPEADLTGLIDARAIRDRILALRDAQAVQGTQNPSPILESDQAILGDIRDILLRIEAKLN